MSVQKEKPTDPVPDTYKPTGARECTVSDNDSCKIFLTIPDAPLDCRTNYISNIDSPSLWAALESSAL
jgi:hypothetical protein